ncbi:hypothetical protein JW921_06900 [Candidatus Fermentibacterales bacterium]|nr:hypothetical protein [Candidatus Fermentibacterales bacterium]
MPALSEHRTRALLRDAGLDVVEAIMVPADEDMPSSPPFLPAWLKAQVPGLTSRKAKGLVRRAGNAIEYREACRRMLSDPHWASSEGMLIAREVGLRQELYAACTLDLGSESSQPGGLLLFGEAGGSGVEARAGGLHRIAFSLLDPPGPEALAASAPQGLLDEALSGFLAGMVGVFLRHRLLVLEVNPLGIAETGLPLAVDCRAEYERSAIPDESAAMFEGSAPGSASRTPLEEIVAAINQQDPSGTGFFRQTRDEVPPGAWKIATNICGGGGKMLWEMATGGRPDIANLNESDTSGGLSAFKSYRILRVIMALPEAQLLVLTGSGMAFQSQYSIAVAVWKALRETPTPLPCLLRFGGTDEGRAMGLFERVSDSLPARVRVYRPEVFPNAMLDDIPAIALEDGSPEARRREVRMPSYPLAFEVEQPPGRFTRDPSICASCATRACLDSCPTSFLAWSGSGPAPAGGDARCVGCLLCEAACLLDGAGGMRIELGLPGEV